MTISKAMIAKLELLYRKTFSEEFKNYLLAKYADEPFPNEYSEQDLYENIRCDIQSYEAGELDITPKSPTNRWQEEREHLRNLYMEKAREVNSLKAYIEELEQTILDHGFESTTMIQRRLLSKDQKLSF